MVPWDSLAPIMITRLIISLKKAANPLESVWSAGQMASVRFARRTIGGSERGGAVALGNFLLEESGTLE